MPLNMFVGQSMVFEVAEVYTDLTKHPPSEPAIWTVDEPTMVNFRDGVPSGSRITVVAISPGTAEITVNIGDTLEQTYTVVVTARTPPTADSLSIILSPPVVEGLPQNGSD